MLLREPPVICPMLVKTILPSNSSQKWYQTRGPPVLQVTTSRMKPAGTVGTAPSDSPSAHVTNTL